MSEDSITIPKSTVKLIVIVFVAAILGSVGGTSIAGMGFGLAPVDAPGGAMGHNQPSGGPSVVVGESYSIGSDDADVIIVEYSDFECPFCGRFHSQTLTQIKTTYIDTGKVKFFYRHLPL